MKRLILCLLLCCLLFSGCSSRQLEEELLVIVLAADQTKDGGIRLTVKVPRNSQAAQGGNQQPSGDYLLLDAAGRGFSEAAALLNATTPRQLNYSQVREIVIGETLSRSAGFAMLLQQIDALPRLRCSATVIICQGEAGSFAAEQKPYVGMRLSRYAETTLTNYAGKGYTPITSLCEGVRDLAYGFQDPLFVFGAVNDFSSPAPQESNVLDALAGDLPRQSGDGVELFGAAATDGVSASGLISGYEMALIHLIQGNVKSLTIRQEEDAPLSLFACAPANLSVDLSTRPALLRVQLACEVRYPPGCIPDEEPLRQRIENDIARMVSHLQSLRCDGLRFCHAAVCQFLTVQDWEKLDWRTVYENARVEIDLSLRCRES